MNKRGIGPVANAMHMRATGVVMIAAAAFSVLLMAHHPSSFHGSGALGGIVHAGMMIAVTLLFVGFARFSQLAGLDNTIVLAALVAFGVATVANLGAATINGMVVPALAARGEAEVGRDVFLFAWEANQALARIGVVATGAAYTGWSLHLLSETGAGSRLIGILGIATGLVPIAVLIVGGYGMDVRTAFAIYSAHAVFSAAVGGWLWRRASQPQATRA